MRAFQSTLGRLSLVRGTPLVALILAAAGCHGGSHETEHQSLAAAKQAITAECRRIELNASRTYSPSRWTDADQPVSPALTFVLGDAILVTKGTAAHQWAELQFLRPTGVWVTCRYDGTSGGDRYSFTSCSDGTQVGATVTATRFKLHVQKGDQKDPAGETVIRAVFEDTACATCDDGDPCTLDEKTTAGCTHLPVPAGADCSDGNPCNGAETCSATGSCVAGAAPTLDDGNVCTADSCEPAVGVMHTPVAAGTGCGDGNACNGNETCDALGTCAAGSPIGLDDGNPCTVDSCDAATGARHVPVPAGTACADGNACNGSETCNATGTCVAGAPPATDDGNPCTSDTCDPATGVQHAAVPAGSSCSDGNACNGPETCDAAAACVAGAAPVVDDGNPCTVDTCDAVHGVAHIPVAAGTSCADGDLCNGAESCNGSGACVAGSSPTLDDHNPCTVDTCDALLGVQHASVSAGTSCADANQCNGGETCNGSGACIAGTPPTLDDGNPCTTDTCDPATGVKHVAVAAGTACADGNACNGAETCNGTGTCVAGAAPAVDDGNPCTTDSCDPTTGVKHLAVASGTSCSDGNACNGSESCNAGGSCVAGPAPTIDDGNPCTADACDPVMGVSHAAIAAGTSCGDGNACNGDETCNAGGTCVGGTAPVVDDGNPCTVDSCNPASGVQHTPAAAGSSCSDGDACNGVETCNGGGSCVAGAAPAVDDGNPCTTDACEPATGVTHTPRITGTSCSDGDACNGLETCNVSGSCVAGAAPTLDDGNPCTADSCDPVTGVQHVVLTTGGSCSDGNACNGAEICNEVGACTTGAPPTLDDGNGCTVDACDPQTGVTHVPAAAGTACADANACNGLEVCNASGGCLAGTPVSVDDGNACTSDACDPATGAVTHSPITTGVCGDTAPPTWTAGVLTASPSSPTNIALSWSAASDDNGVTGYRVYRGASLIATVTTRAYEDGSLATGTIYAYRVEAFDAAGNLSTGGPTATVQPLPELVPSVLNRTVVSDIADVTDFLWKGAGAVQQGVVEGTIDRVRVAVLRGRVSTRSGDPVAGVEVTVLDHPEYGKTFSRSDGNYDLAINGGGTLAVSLSKPGYALARRNVSPTWHDYQPVSEVVLVPFDSAVTEVDVSGDAADTQVAQATIQTDGHGTRRATLMFAPETTAQIQLPNGGGTSSPETIHVRATEFTVGPSGPAAMPADLPAASAYTYAIELSTDEARALASHVTTFDKPVSLYVDNFLGFPVGTSMPLGSYDYERNVWVTRRPAKC